MDDKELVEVWKKEFESEFKTQSAYGFQKLDGEYCSFMVESAWQGFLLAKRSRPSAFLPKPLICYNKNGQVDEVYTIEQLTAAGSKYTVKD